ncbi:MAG: hypothetical protein QOI59_746 [Gammaproteobacteria bacterium]|nr:hypothetical protein [Gammaproteobacteria bacterium]
MRRASQNVGQLILRQGEDHRNGMHLCDCHDPGRICDMHNGSRIDQSQTDTPIRRCDQPCKSQLQLRGIDCRLIGANRRLQRLNLGFGRLERLSGDPAGIDESRVAIYIDLGIAQLCLILGTRRLGLGLLHLERTRVNLCQQVPGMHLLALREGNLVQLPVNTDFDLHHTQRLYGTNAIECNRHVPSSGTAHHYGHRRSVSTLFGGLRG